jgi:uncharacterized protein
MQYRSYRIKIPNSTGHALSAELSFPGTAGGTLAVFFHGLFDSSRNHAISKIKGALLAEGISTLTFDYFAHGESEGMLEKVTPHALISEVKTVTRYITDAGFSRLAFIAGSFGAYPAIFEAASNADVKGLVLLNPLSDFMEVALSRKSNDALGRYTSKHKTAPLLTKIMFFISIMDYNMYSTAGKIKCPVLAFHSIDDEIVPYAQSKRLERSIRSKKKFIFLKGENHNLDRSGLLQKRIIPDVVKWIKRIK